MSAKAYWGLFLATSLLDCSGGAESSPAPSSGGISFAGSVQPSSTLPVVSGEEGPPAAEMTDRQASSGSAAAVEVMGSADAEPVPEQAEGQAPESEDGQLGEVTPVSTAPESLETESESSAEVSGEVSPQPGVVSPVFPDGSIPRIMIVGDSISAGPGCYKGELVERLRNAGISAFQFVGEYSDDCGAGVMHSAVSCSTAEHYTQSSFTMSNCFVGQEFEGLAPLVAAHQPDLLMLQLGVNDVWNGRSTDEIVADYDELVRQARASNPGIVIAVAQIQQIRPDCDPADSSVFDRARNLVEAVPQWATRVGTTESPIFVADLWTNSDWSQAETTDCVHPNEVGAARMADNWFTALRPILNSDG